MGRVSTAMVCGLIAKRSASKARCRAALSGRPLRGVVAAVVSEGDQMGGVEHLRDGDSGQRAANGVALGDLEFERLLAWADSNHRGGSPASCLKDERLPVGTIFGQHLGWGRRGEPDEEDLAGIFPPLYPAEVHLSLLRRW